ncbi:hypothetical protein ILYODFUR_034042 [Ilyodon furcidens]|uniref:Uncharacterized protein n=1 Tax=Ilyodon furcidens TaxID=33524 RepID=A0ABV0VJC6_9TELE
MHHSLAWGLLLLCPAGDLILRAAYGSPGVAWLSGTAASLWLTCPLLILGAVDCRPSTVLTTLTHVHLQVTNTHTHSTQTHLFLHLYSHTLIYTQLLKMVEGHTNTDYYNINLACLV